MKRTPAKGACTYDVCAGGGQKADESNDVLRGCDSDKEGGGDKIIRNVCRNISIQMYT